MSRPLHTLPLPPGQRVKLTRAGFETTAELLEVSAIELAKELGIPRAEALELLEVVRSSSLGHGRGGGAPGSAASVVSASTGASSGGAAAASGGGAGPAVATSAPHQHRGRTALDVLAEERQRSSIVTLCAEWDRMLGGGVPLTKITEFCGAPGIGKTQLGMQLAMNVQIPVEFGGNAGEAVYIDTEGSFIVERAEEIGMALVDHMQGVVGGSAIEGFDLESVLSRIHYFRIHDYVQQLAVVQTLPAFLEQHPEVKLVVVDSIAFHFRQDFEDMALRTRLLNGMAQHLMRLASQHKLAVVLMNQMTTKYVGSKMQLAPALGESWGHAATNRVIMCWENGIRKATLYKSPTMQEATIAYTVTADGIRSLPLTYDGDDADGGGAHDGGAQYAEDGGTYEQYNGGGIDAAQATAAAAAHATAEQPDPEQRKRARLEDGGFG